MKRDVVAAPDPGRDPASLAGPARPGAGRGGRRHRRAGRRRRGPSHRVGSGPGAGGHGGQRPAGPGGRRRRGRGRGPEALEASPAVADLARVRTFVVDGGGDFDLTLVGDPEGRRGSRHGPAGRLGRVGCRRPTPPTRWPSTRSRRTSLGLGVGDELSLGDLLPRGRARPADEDDFQGFNGAEPGPAGGRGHPPTRGPAGRATPLRGRKRWSGPAFFTEHADVGGFPEVFSLRLTDPATGAAEVERIVTGLAR